jgi:hypothetical protein
MNIRSLVAMCGRAVWWVGLVAAVKSVFHLFRPAEELTKSEEKQRRKHLIAEEKKKREKSHHVAA